MEFEIMSSTANSTENVGINMTDDQKHQQLHQPHQDPETDEQYLEEESEEFDIVPLQYMALKEWWDRHHKSFCEWFLLTLTNERRQEVLLRASPDMPRESCIVRSGLLSATDRILPEISLDSLSACDGKILTLLVTRRCTSKDYMLSKDVTFVNEIFHTGILPDFSQGVLLGLDTPFVDPLDPTEFVQSLDQNTSPTIRQQVAEHLKSGRMVRAEVWLAVKIRRMSMVTFMISLAMSHQRGVSPKPSPTFKALFEAEVALYRSTVTAATNS